MSNAPLKFNPKVWIFTQVTAGRCDLTLRQGEDGQTVTEQEDRPAHIGSYLENRTKGEMAAEHRSPPDP